MDPRLTEQIRDRVGAEIADGRYRIVARLAEGSMGEVYRAVDGHLGADVVIKFPIAPSDSPDESEFLARFHRESRSLIRLSHPHIVKVTDAGEDDGLPFVVMPYLDGGSLKDRIETGADGEPRTMPPGLLHGWLPDMADALDFLHEQGHVHRDVKPANILFDRHGHAFLGDFGVIKVPGIEEEAWKGRSALTTPGYLLGTPNYVAPELIMGQPCDGRADQYALALTVHESLIGWNVMEGPTPSATMVNQTKVEPPAPGALLRDVPRRLSDAVLRGLSKEPADRFEDCAAMAREMLADVPRPVPGHPLLAPVPKSAASEGEPGRVPCPACGGLLPVTREHAGRRVTCARCRAIAVVQLAAKSLRLRMLTPPASDSETPPDGLEPPEDSAPSRDRKARRRSRRTVRRWLILAGLLAVAAALGSPILVRYLAPSPRDDRGPIRSIPPLPDRQPLEINIAHGTEKKHWLEAAAREFEGSPEGKGIVVNLIARGSLQGADDILDGPGPRPIHAWSPAAGAYREVFEREWKARKPGTPPPILKGENLALSPLVFVFWKDRYEAFLLKYGTVNFRTLGEALREPGGWGTIASRPDWGPFRFAHTNPARSNSGLMTLALMAYEVAGKSRGLSKADIAQPGFRAALQAFERGASRRGASLPESTGTLMEEMVLRGPSEFDGLVVYENLAIDYLKAAERNWGELRVAYPDPNLWNEHPFYILDVPWSERPHQEAAAAFLKFLMTEPMQRLALTLGFRPGNPAVDARSPDSPILRMEKYGLRIEVPRMAEAPRAEAIADLLAASRKVGP